MIKSLKRNKAPGVDQLPSEIYMFGGKDVKNMVLQLANKIKNSIEVPEQFNHMVITTLHKKGSVKFLKNKRGVFLSLVISKIVEKLIKGRIDEALKNVNPLQAESRRNRGSADNLFLIRGIIDHA